MAIFRAATKHISRSKGQNVVAAAAYRAGEKLTDSNKLNPTATTHDYTKKHGVVAKEIVLPAALSGQGFSINRQELWSSVEEHETTTRSVKGSRLKQTARLAREWLLSLPSELSDDENEQLTAEFTQKLANDLGVIGDYCIHKPSSNDYKPKPDYLESYDPDTQKTELIKVDDWNASEPDNRNIHAHIMFTTRKAEITADGKLSLGDKADSERSEKWRKDNGMVNGGDYIKEIRGIWADMVNKRLVQHDIVPISHKSYKELGLDIIPQRKEGKNATALARYGIQTDVRNKNDVIKERNRAAIESAADSHITSRSEAAARASTGATRAGRATQAANEWLHKADSWLSKAAPKPFDPRSRVIELDEQTIVFDRLAKRADRLTEQATKSLSESLIQKAVAKYKSVKTYEPYIQRSDWAGSDREPRVNPEPNPGLEFNERQLGIIERMSEHLEGHDDDYVSHSALKKCLTIQANERILMLLIDPKREQMQHEEDSRERAEQVISPNATLDDAQDLQRGVRQEERELKPSTPRHTYRPR